MRGSIVLSLPFRLVFPDYKTFGAELTLGWIFNQVVGVLTLITRKTF
jgi:hypothetical protein